MKEIRIIFISAILILSACKKTSSDQNSASRPLPAYYLRAYMNGRAIIFDSAAYAIRDVKTDSSIRWRLQGSNFYFPDSLKNHLEETLVITINEPDSVTTPGTFTGRYPNPYTLNAISCDWVLKAPEISHVYVSADGIDNNGTVRMSIITVSDSILTGTFSGILSPLNGVPDAPDFTEPVYIQVDSGTYRLPVRLEQ